MARKVTFAERMFGLMPRDASDLDMIKDQLESHLKKIEFLSKIAGWTAFAMVIGKYGMEQHSPGSAAVIGMLALAVIIFSFFSLFTWILIQFTYPPAMSGKQLGWRFQRNRVISLLISCAIFGPICYWATLGIK